MINTSAVRFSGTCRSATEQLSDVNQSTSRFLSRNECTELLRRTTAFAQGEGSTTVYLESRWTGNLRWARNRIVTSGDVRNNDITVVRSIRGAEGRSSTNRIDDERLQAAVRHAERFVPFSYEYPDPSLRSTFIEPYPEPKIWSDATYRQSAQERAELMHRLVAPVAKAGMLAAGYVQVSAHGRASMLEDRVWYYPYTLSQYSVTVRDPQGTGSGWAGVDQSDWEKIDVEQLSATALDKCLRSRNPVRIEPGRYTVILEPQAVCDLVESLFRPDSLDRVSAEFGDPSPGDSPYRTNNPISPYMKGNGYSMLGERIIDERLTVSLDPMDPELGFPPFSGWQVFHPATWIRNGVLTELSYVRSYAVKKLGKNTGGLPATGAFRMGTSGQTVSIDEMISTTKRGLVVTRFSDIAMIDPRSALLSGYTRDGLWLVENGKISKAVKNLKFTESPLFVLNNVEQVGVSQRVFHPGNGVVMGYVPVIAPLLKVRDFSFTGLSDAV